MKDQKTIKNEKDEKDEENKSDEIIETLIKYLSGMLGIGVCAIMFSQVCSRQFILLAFSKKWATDSAVVIMKAYCGYLMFMSANGMAEAFAYGLANEKVLG